jgi:hypothetical protein
MGVGMNQMTEEDIRQIKLIIQSEAENLACMFGEGPDDVLYKIQHITKHYDKLDTFVKNQK